MDLVRLGAWMDAYGAAWKSNKADEVRALFTEDAVYYVSPFKPPRRGREEIVAAWIADPESQEDIEFEHTPISATADEGVAHWRVRYVKTEEPKANVELDGILVLRFDAEHRCSEHREWYFNRETPR